MKMIFFILDRKKITILLVRFSSLFVQLGYIRVYTHYLSLSQLGIFFYLSSISYFMNSMIFVPVDYYQQTHMPTDPAAPIPLKYLIDLNRRAIFGALIAGLGIVIYSFFDKNIKLYEVVLTFVLSVLLYLCTSLRSLLNNRSHGIFVVFMLMIEASLKLVLFIALVSGGQASADMLIASNVVALACEFLIILYFFYSYEKFDFLAPGRVSNRDLVRFCYPISISAVCNWIQLQGYRLVYVWFGHPDIAGLYATVSNIGSVGMSAGSQIYAQLFQPRIYQSKGLFIKKYLVMAFCISAIALASYTVLGPFILGILTKGDFKIYYKLMLFGVLVEACNLMIGAITAFSGLIKRTNVLVKTNLIGVFISVSVMGLALYFDASNSYLIGTSLGLSQLVILFFLLSFVRRAFANSWVPRD
jgi:O-antigen/teichoic acid export membrane protein